MKIVLLFAAAVLFGSCARANYPVKRVEGTILFVNQSFTGMRVLAGGKVLTIELGYVTSVRKYEMHLASSALNVGDEVSMFEKGNSRVVFDKSVTGLVKSQNPLTFSVELFWKSGATETREGVFEIGDYARLDVKKLPPFAPPIVPDGMCVLYAPLPTYVKTYSITKPERVEFTRFYRRKLCDLAVNQTVSVYVGILPNGRLRSRGVAILN